MVPPLSTVVRTGPFGKVCKKCAAYSYPPQLQTIVKDNHYDKVSPEGTRFICGGGV